MKLKLFLTAMFALSVPVILNAGTIMYKTESKGEEYTLSKIKIVSIAKNTITIKQDNAVRTIPLRYLVSYYDTDISTGGEFADNTCDYSITISDVDMPKTGYTYVKSKKSKRKKVSECEIKFSINKKYEKGKTEAIRMPYFYLFVLTTSSEAYGRLPVFIYSYPKESKVASKTYDEAKIIESVNSMKRPRINYDVKSHLGKAGDSLKYSGGYPPIKISLRGIKNQTIIAYHLEVWGKDKVVAIKDWNDSTKYRVGKNWWKRY